MIPMGLEHFVHIFPQPGYFTTIPLQHETLFAFLHSHLFDAVKAVELLTGIAVLFSCYAPLMLLVCMTVVFNVIWWDAPLAHYNMGSVMAGGKVLVSNISLCGLLWLLPRDVYAAPEAAADWRGWHCEDCGESGPAAVSPGRSHHFWRLDVAQRRQLPVLRTLDNADRPRTDCS